MHTNTMQIAKHYDYYLQQAMKCTNAWNSQQRMQRSELQFWNKFASPRRHSKSINHFQYGCEIFQLQTLNGHKL